MNRNQKVALGCGGAGCLGLIVVVVAAGLIYFFSYRQAYSTNRNHDFNVNSNRRSNSNSVANENSSSSSSVRATSMSNDDRHKLYHAASMTADAELLRRVSVKIGLMNEDYTPGDDYQKFVVEHVNWVLENTGFVQSIRTQEQAQAYVNQHFPD